jgi:hypothetical protein
VTPITNANLLRVMSRDRTKVYLLDYTRLINRPAGRHADSLVTFGEAARGEAPPILHWFPAGSDQGHEFIYNP